MATEKLFTVAGISKLPSTHGSEYKVRFANDVMRVKVLLKGGHEDVRLVELDAPSTKMEAVQILKGMDEFSDVIAQATLNDFIEENTPKAPREKAVKAPKIKPESTPTATKAPKAKIEMPTDMEDAPF
jgi:hypothetical protein